MITDERRPLHRGARAKVPTLLTAAVAAAVLAVFVAGPAVPAEVGQVRADPNDRLGDDQRTARGKDAPGLAVNPADPDHVAAIGVDMFAGDCEHHVSVDRGATWASGVFTAPPEFATPLCQTGPGAGAMDAGVAFGSGSTVYATWSSARPGEGRSVLVAASSDGGRTYPPATVAAGGGPTGGANYLLPKLVVDPRPEGDRIYVVARRTVAVLISETVVIRSDDGGETWTDPVVASEPGVPAIEQTQPVVAPDGAVSVGWRTQGNVGSIVVARSTDGGETWTRREAATVQGYQANTASSFPRLAVDGRDGSLYVVYGQGPEEGASQPSGRSTEDHFIHPDSDVLSVRSTDGGETWSDPVRVNDDPLSEVITARHPGVAVAPDGRVDVVWHDRRHAYRAPTDSHGGNGEARLGDTYYAYSTDGGQTFSVNRRITDRTINNDIGLDYRSGTYWSFGPVSAALGPDELLIAWMDSREGNVNTDTQDFYLSRVHVHAEGPAPVHAVAETNDVDRAIALSRQAYPGGPSAVLAGTFSNEPVTRVVVVEETDVAGAIAGGVLARANLGPLLVSPSSGLPPSVSDEVARMSPIGAYVIGGEDRLSPQVVADLEAAGVPSDEIVRLEGPTAPDIAAQIADAMDTRSDDEGDEPAFDAVIVVNAATPDAAAVGSVAAARRLPVLLVERDAIPQATADALESLGIEATLVIGGPDAISDDVAAQLPSPTRLGGDGGAVTTSVAVAAESRARGLPANMVFVADVDRPMDGALLGAAAGRIGGLLLLQPSASVDGARAAMGELGVLELVDRFIVAAAGAAGTDPGGGGGPVPAPGGVIPATGGDGASTALPVLLLAGVLLAARAAVRRC